MFLNENAVIILTNFKINEVKKTLDDKLDGCKEKRRRCRI